MNDKRFGPLAYRLGNQALIRQKLLESAQNGEPVGDAESAIVAEMRDRPNAAEAAWLVRYDRQRERGRVTG
jgi:hypothetical protein